MKSCWEITDPDAVYPLYSCRIAAESIDDALVLTLEAMMQCPQEVVDDEVFHSALMRLEVREIDPRS
jgi:hypothetical protein